METIKRLKNDKKLLVLVIGCVLLTLFIPYVTLPLLLIWWFYKKSKFPKKAKKLTTLFIGGILTVSVIGIVVAYVNDPEPHLKVVEPATISTIKASQVTIKGSYDPADRKVWVNGKEIKTSNGVFESLYQLKEGENKIEVSVGNWKRDRINIMVNRELTEEEKVVLSTPTSSVTVKPMAKPTLTVLEKIKSFAASKYPQFETTVWNKDSGFASEGQVPYEIIVNGSLNKTIVSDCSGAKRLAYDMIVTFYNDPEIRPTLSRVLITIPYYLRISIGANDGVPIAEKNLLGGVNGPTYFWNTLEKVGLGENENGDMKNRTWGNYLTNCTK